MNILLLIFTFFLTLFGIHILIRHATWLGLVDLPNKRSMHKVQTPKGAGIGFIGSVLLSLLLFDPEHLIDNRYVYLAILMVLGIGMLEDKMDISPRFKYVGIFFATLLLYFHGTYIDCLGSYFGLELCLPLGLPALLFSFFAIAGYTNALKLIDGIDGLAGAVSIIILGAFLAIGVINDDELIITLSSLQITSLIAFLYFNWSPAKVFMGKSGSLTLGFVISLLSIKSLAYITPAAMLFIIAIPILDTFIVMTRRIQRGWSLFTADKNHMHHLLYKMKDDVGFTVILLSTMQLVFTTIGFQLRSADNLLSLILFAILFYIFLNLFDQRIKKRQKKKKNKRAGRHKRADHMLESTEQRQREAELPGSLSGLSDRDERSLMV